MYNVYPDEFQSMCFSSHSLSSQHGHIQLLNGPYSLSGWVLFCGLVLIIKAVRTPDNGAVN